MATYHTGNQAKVVDAAKRLLAADPNSLRALALLTFLARQSITAGQNPQENRTICRHTAQKVWTR